MKNLIAITLLLLLSNSISAQDFFIGTNDTVPSRLTPKEFKARYAGKGKYTVKSLKIGEPDRYIFVYSASPQELLIERTGKTSYQLTSTYNVPLAPDSTYVPLKLMRTRLSVGKEIQAAADTAYLHEQLKGRIKKSEDLIATWEELKKELSKSSKWDEYDAQMVDKTAILGWELTLAYLSGDTSLYELLKNYRTDIFLVNAGESSAIFAECEMLLAQNNFR